MNLNIQQDKVRNIRESMISQLETLYRINFEKLLEQGIDDKYLARITQLLLNSKEGAINPLKEEIEAPLITKAPPK